MKRLLVLLLSLMLATSMLVLGEGLSDSVGNPANPTNNIVLPVEPQVPQINEPKAGEPVNQPQKSEGMGQLQYQPKPQPPQGNPGQPQNNFNKNQPLPPNVGNQPGKYGQPQNSPPGFQDKEGQNQQEMLPPLDKEGNSLDGQDLDEQDHPTEIPEAGGVWVPLKKIGNFFYFWKPKDALKEEQAGEMQEKAPKGMGNTKNAPQFQPGKFQNGTGQNEGEGNQYVGNQEGTGEEEFQAAYEKDKANTKVDIQTFKNDPAKTDAEFKKIFDGGKMEIVLVKNMKLVKSTAETENEKVDKYLWPSHDKIITLTVPEGESLDQNLLAFEYLGKYPSKLYPKGDSLGLPSGMMNEKMNLPPLEETPQFEGDESSVGEQGSSADGGMPSLQAGIPEGATEGNSQQQFTPQAPPGCKVGDKGVPTGFRLLNEGLPQYCDMDEQLHTQKELDASCQNNFECQSNQCSSGKCLDLNAKMEETQSLLQKILAWLGAKE
ncbi:hypothetical protein HZC30_03130 [Candidatus Woesearchaeota archaeon]|nr:hypothetical protein [Candidatus Woesearchaeota archaeon]